MRVTREFKFDAAHYLPNYPGKCAMMHGHTYKMEVTLEGNINQDTHMVMDFHELGDKVKPTVEKFDHHLINEYLSYPTVELMVEYVWNELYPILGEKLQSIRMWEGPLSYAEKTR